jgi:hypothetical protein
LGPVESLGGKKRPLKINTQVEEVKRELVSESPEEMEQQIVEGFGDYLK